MALHRVTLQQLPSLGGADLGVTAYRTVTQREIDGFADATDDHQWLHTAELAGQGPFGGAVAQGFLTLALLTPLSHELLRVDDAAARINYGLDRVRFTGPVPAGARVRLAATVDVVAEVPQGMKVTTINTIEVEALERPAVVARFTVLYMR